MYLSIDWNPSNVHRRRARLMLDHLPADFLAIGHPHGVAPDPIAPSLV